VYSTRLRLCALASSILRLSSCSAPKIAMPTEYCSPVRGDKMVCNSKSLTFPDAGGMMCFFPHEIEPFLERCGAK
jgi:hypothetical protein